MFRGDIQVSKSNFEDEGGNRTGWEGKRWRGKEKEGTCRQADFQLLYKKTSPFTT